MYEEIEIFGEKIRIKNYLCSSNPNKIKRQNAKLNLYIKINDACNAKCEFCSNRDMQDMGNINLEKLEYVLDYLNKRNLLNRISITGGEPMLKLDLLNKVANLIFKVIPNAMVTINTNGFNLRRVVNLDSINKIEGIHISRHHYEDELNKQIFKMDVATKEDIEYVMSNVTNKKLLRLNCLLIKDYIDKPEEVEKYLEFASELGIFRVGFVSLMKVNGYCKENYINFNSVFKKEIMNPKTIAHFYDMNICECINGVYISKKGKFVEWYARMTKELNCEYSRQFVYTSDNKLTTGFGKAIII